jgi:NAD(P)-dependent dehydrogenase (short-subunit alcohol dehydrogenase family)
MLGRTPSEQTSPVNTGCPWPFFLSSTPGGEITSGNTSQVINVSPISGVAKGSSNGKFAYACSKSAFMHLSRTLATILKDVKVRVNVIAPGVFPSEMTAGGSGDDNKSTLDMETPLGRVGCDSDMAATVLFLAGKGGVFYNEKVSLAALYCWVIEIAADV